MMGIFDIFSKLGGNTNPDPYSSSAITSGAPALAPVSQASLPSADVTTQPPVTGGGGIGGFLSKINHFVNDENPNTGTSFADKLGLFGAQLQDTQDGGKRAASIQDRMDESLENNKNAEKQGQLASLADQMKMDPRERFMFLTDQKKWAEAYAPHFYGEGGAAGYATPGGGLHSEGALPVSPQQAAQHQATEDRLKAMEEHWSTLLPLLTERAHAATTTAEASMKRADKMKAGGAAGGGGGANAGVMAAIEAAIRAKGGH